MARDEAAKFLVSTTKIFVEATKFLASAIKFGSADQKFGTLNLHHFFLGLTKHDSQPDQILVNPTKWLLGCPNPHKRLEAPTKFLYEWQLVLAFCKCVRG